MVTKENFDLIFSDVHPPSESHSSDSDISGILLLSVVKRIQAGIKNGLFLKMDS